MIRAFLFLSALWSVTAAAWADAPRVTVFAAASLRGVLEGIAEGYEGTLNLSFGGSGTMARQVAAGAPADLVILANTNWMNWLVDQGLVQTDAPQVVAGNRLVLIGPSGTPLMSDPMALPVQLGSARLAMGQRDAVPAGIYARQWLTAAGLWESVAAQLAETDNVRAALALVARNETPLGIVYASDAAAEPRVEVVYTIPPHTHDPITYPAAALSPAGADLLAHLLSTSGQSRFTAHSFAPPPS